VAQTDFTFYAGGAGGMDTYLPSQGKATFNSALSSPFTDGGMFCREWYTRYSSGDTGFFARINQTGSVDKFTGMYAVSMRCAIRPATASNGEIVTKAGLIGKGTATYTAINSNSYYFRVENNTQFNFMGTSINNPLNTSLMNKWTNLRLDVIPVLSNATVTSDIVTAYVESGSFGSGEWTQVTSSTLEVGNAKFIAWDKTTKFFGFGFYGNPVAAAVQTCYFDKFQVYIDPLS
jgi:hypothetical protein